MKKTVLRGRIMRIRKATGEEMLALWGYRDEKNAPPTARFFYRSISNGSAVFWALDNGSEPVGELYAFLDLEDKDFADGKTTAEHALTESQHDQKRQDQHQLPSSDVWASNAPPSE